MHTLRLKECGILHILRALKECGILHTLRLKQCHFLHILRGWLLPFRGTVSAGIGIEPVAWVKDAIVVAVPPAVLDFYQARAP